MFKNNQEFLYRVLLFEKHFVPCALFRIHQFPVMCISKFFSEGSQSRRVVIIRKVRGFALANALPISSIKQRVSDGISSDYSPSSSARHKVRATRARRRLRKHGASFISPTILLPRVPRGYPYRL